MSFISGWIGLLTALDPTGNNAVTEAAARGYARQLVRFSIPSNGISKLAAPFTFGCMGVGPTAGRAIYSQPTGGFILFVMPHGTGIRQLPSNGPIDARDVGEITLFLSAMANYPDGEAYSSSLFSTSGSAFGVGTVYDSIDEGQALWAQQPGPGGVMPKAIAKATLSAGFSGELLVQRGSVFYSQPQPGT